MRRPSPRLLWLALPLLLLGCVRDPEAEAQRVQQLLELGDALNDLQLQMSEQAATMDSLRLVVARQDSVLRLVSGHLGVYYK